MKCLDVLLLMCGCSITAAHLKVDIYPLSKSLPVRTNLELNLTCIASDDEDQDKIFNISWTLPNKEMDRSRVRLFRTENTLVLSLSKLQRADAGAYICEARDDDDDVMESQIITVFVNAGREKCLPHFFDCGKMVCIPLHFVCDGYRDCPDGSDESVENCGHNACEGKIFCDGRCISKKFCCDHRVDANCSTHYVIPCCYRYFGDGMPVNIFEMDSSDTPVTFKYHNLGFYQSTIYTMISCAIAFIFMSTIMLIAVCRIRMRRNAWFLQSGRQPSPHQRPWEQQCSILEQRINSQHMENRQSADHNFSDHPEVVDPMENFVLLTFDSNTGFQVAEYGPKPPPYVESNVGIPPPPYSSTINLSGEEQPSDTAENQNEEPSQAPPTNQI